MKYISTILLLLLSLQLIAGNEPDHEQSKYAIFPNPAFNHIKISDCENIEGIKVYDLTGKVVLNKKSTCEINIASLPDGIYVLKIEAGDELHTRKLIKNS